MTKLQTYILYKCITFGVSKLGVTTPYKIRLSNQKKEFVTFAFYDPVNKIIAVYTKDRSIADICRSSIHELVHHRQNEMGKLTGNEPDIGRDTEEYDVENEANAKAGAIIKEFSYKLRDEENIDIYSH